MMERVTLIAMERKRSMCLVAVLVMGVVRFTLVRERERERRG